jgi:hypothetical protein
VHLLHCNYISIRLCLLSRCLTCSFPGCHHVKAVIPLLPDPELPSSPDEHADADPEGYEVITYFGGIRARRVFTSLSFPMFHSLAQSAAGTLPRRQKDLPASILLRIRHRQLHGLPELISPSDISVVVDCPSCQQSILTDPVVTREVFPHRS